MRPWQLGVRRCNLILWHVLALLIAPLIGCGGGGGGGSQPPPNPDFSLSVSPASQSVDAGTSAPVSLSAASISGFSSQVTVQLAGVPAGVSVSPASITLVPGTPQQVTLTAATNAPNATATVTFTGTAGSLTHRANLSLTVNGVSNGTPIRTRYVRTDATTEYFGWVNQHWILYHAATGRYFVSDTSSNQIIVLDAASKTVIAKIGVPGAFGMDDTPDQATIYVGTQIGDVYAVDPVMMTVTKRYIGSEIGPYGFPASSVLVLDDGRLALIGLYNGIDGTGYIAVWNPLDNSLTTYNSYVCGGVFWNLGGFERTVDRTQILIGPVNGGGLCEINPATGTGVSASSASSLHIVTSPDGKYIILPNYPSGVVVYDSQTLAPVSQFDVLGDLGSDSSLFVSSDSKTLYVPNDWIIYAYDLASHQLVGWTPNIFVTPISGGFAFGPIDSPFLLATDGSGLYAGPMEQGIGFVDLSHLQTGTVGTQFANGYLDPNAGPTAGGTATKWSTPGAVASLKSVYFGSQAASGISATGGYIYATSPAGKAGPADVYAFTNDGGMQLLPEAFSYGPTILQVTPNMAMQEGGGTGHIYGYGLGSIDSTGIPPDLTVTVGGVSVQITGFVAYAYPTIAPPLPLQSVAFTIPPGVNGASADVVVSNNSGSATATAALSYLPNIQQFPLKSAVLAQGIYDPYTDLYYFTDASKIQVFSRTQAKWLSPIPIPAPPGTTQRLWGIALSPDGSKLAVSDLNAGAIYILDPANPNAVKTFIVGSTSGFTINPSGLAISDSGNVYYMVVVLGQGGGADQFFKLNTNDGTILDYHLDGPGFGENDAYLRNAISADNARVFYNMDGLTLSIDTATDQIYEALDGFGCCYGNYELALSANQTQFTATFYIYDTDLNGESYYAMNDRELLDIQYVYGAKLSPDGRLLFQPSLNGIDVFDGRLGNLRARISLPVALSANYDALVANGRDNVLIANTGSGIAIIDLTSLPEPSFSKLDVSSARRRATASAPLSLKKFKARRFSQHKELVQPRLVPHVTKSLVR